MERIRPNKKYKAGRFPAKISRSSRYFICSTIKVPPRCQQGYDHRNGQARVNSDGIVVRSNSAGTQGNQAEAMSTWSSVV